MTPTCYCGQPAILRTSKYGRFWSCSHWPDCDGVVGCHPGTDRPLGKMADKRTRTARKRAHDAFDALWLPMGKERREYRKAAYEWLAEALGVDEAHIGEMDLEAAEHVARVCGEMGPEDVEAWL